MRDMLRKKLLVLVLVGFVAGIFPGIAQKYTIDIDQIFGDRGEVYFKFENPGHKQLIELTRAISIDNVKKSNEVYAYANKKEFINFLGFDIDFEILTAPSLMHQVKMKDKVNLKEIDDWDFYPTYEAYVEMMYQFETDYPDLCDVFSIGQTIEGREIIFAKISDNISQNEGEAQFLYTGTMHGDETAGYVIFLRLIDYLLSNYGTDPRVDNMVNGLEIWINPLANPDGTFHGGNNTINGAQRYNSNGVDLNRNYPDPEDGPHPDGNEWQVETLLFMQLAEDNHFTMAANTHGGAEVVNYPWDTWPTLAADDAWWQYVSHEFADTAQANSPNGYLDGFNDGITNGYQWYTTSGNRQDYMNYFHQCREVTLEISDTKLIPESQLEAHWDYTYRSFLNYLEQVMFGVSGTITDADSGEPVYAEVFIDGHDMDSSWVYSQEDFGTYYRLLMEGTFDITFTAYGYFPQTIENVVVVNRELTQLDVQLEGADLIADFEASETSISPSSSIDFTDLTFGDITSWEWEFEGGEPSVSDLQNPTGILYNETGTFDVTLTVSNGTDSQTIIKEDYIDVFEQYLMQDGTFTINSGLFLDSGGAAYNYGDDEDYTMTFIPESSNGKVVADFVVFLVEYHQNCDYDWLKIFNGSDIQASEIGTYCGGDSPGIVVASNDEGALTFQFHSDYSVSEPGWLAHLSVDESLVAPLAEFCANDSSVNINSYIEFTDLSENNPTEWDWYFEGGTPETSTEQNPEIMYDNPGVYNVELTVTNEAGSNTILKEDFILVEEFVGLKENADSRLAIYPNPASNKVYFQSDSELEYVQVYDLMGKVVLSVKLDGNQKSIDISELNDGIYFLNIRTVDSSISRKLQVSK